MEKSHQHRTLIAHGPPVPEPGGKGSAGKGAWLKVRGFAPSFPC